MPYDSNHMQSLDLHMHTTYSDGLLSVDDMVKRCHDRGLQIIAITDHDTIDHIEPAIRLGGRVSE